MTQTQIKFRPVLSIQQISKIISLAQSESPLSRESKSILRTLVPFKAKAENSAIVGVATKSENLESTLGFNSEPKESGIQELYRKWENKVSLSIHEIERVHQYRYESNLMTPEEESEYEKYILS